MTDFLAALGASVAPDGTLVFDRDGRVLTRAETQAWWNWARATGIVPTRPSIKAVAYAAPRLPPAQASTRAVVWTAMRVLDEACQARLGVGRRSGVPGGAVIATVDALRAHTVSLAAWIASRVEAWTRTERFDETRPTAPPASFVFCAKRVDELVGFAHAFDAPMTAASISQTERDMTARFGRLAVALAGLVGCYDEARLRRVVAAVFPGGQAEVDGLARTISAELHAHAATTELAARLGGASRNRAGRKKKGAPDAD